MPSLTRQQLILVLIFAHGDDNDCYEAKNHTKDLNTINWFPIVVVAEDWRPEGARLEEND